MSDMDDESRKRKSGRQLATDAPAKRQKATRITIPAASLAQAALGEAAIAFPDESIINQDQFYHLLVGLDLLYSGTMRSAEDWNLSLRRTTGIARFIYKQYILRASGELDASTQRITKCAYPAQSNYKIFENSKGKRLLYVSVCWGSKFSTDDFKREWADQAESGPLAELRQVLQDSLYHQLIFSGHSMGAGLVFMIILEIFNPDRGFSFPAHFDPQNIFLNFFGLGRLPTRLCETFFARQEHLKFKVLDFLTFSGITGGDDRKDAEFPYFDSHIDEIQVSEGDCDPRESQFYYCGNETLFPNPSEKQRSTFREIGLNHAGCKPLDGAVPKLFFGPATWYEQCSLFGRRKPYAHPVVGSLPPEHDFRNQEIPEKYRDCVNAERWGDMYSDKWNECQDFFDMYHQHNAINTFGITKRGTIEALSKNTALRDLKVKFSGPRLVDARVFQITDDLHTLRTYVKFFESNDLVGALNAGPGCG